MKRQKPYKIMVNLVILCVALAFAGCGEDDSENSLSISEITITNIPVDIPVDNGGGSNQTFKIYLNASDSQDIDQPPAAQGFKKFLKEDGTLDGGVTRNGNTYTITIPLRKPIVNLKGKPGYDPTLDPNNDNGPWSGTAANFSLLLAPQDVSGGLDTIWVKGSTVLDKSKARLDWNSTSLLMDFRNPNLAHPPLSLPDKAQALLEDVVCRDPDIISQ
jgi:hypothetical protein